jgi:gamma-glutamylcyclotransferase (GGCT)/AIG2-like uncharacterized protein YtfP
MRYFAYGVNIDPRTMGQVSPDARELGLGRLTGFRLIFNVYSTRWKGGAANLEPDPTGHVWGVVWEVPDGDGPKLDTFVGHPTFYRQETAEVQVGGTSVECLTYRVAHQHGFVRPDDGYLNTLRSASRQQGLPPEALDQLERAAEPPYPRID